MKKIISSIVIVTSLVLTGCAVTNPMPSQPSVMPSIKQGMVIGIKDTTLSVNDPNLAGAAIGGVAGGVVGHQFGKGNCWIV